MAPGSSKEFFDIQTNYRVWIHFETHTWHDNNMQTKQNSYRKFQINEFSGTSISHVFSFIRTSFHDFQKLDNSLYDDNNFCFTILKLDVLSISFSVWVRNSFQRRNNSYTDNNIIEDGTLVLLMKI